MTRITVYAGPAKGTDAIPTVRDWSEHGPEEALRRIGLEFKQADYFGHRQVVIVLDPVDANEATMDVIKGKVRDAAGLLEETGLL